MVGGVESESGEQGTYEAGAEEDSPEHTRFGIAVPAGGEELANKGEKRVEES